MRKYKDDSGSTRDDQAQLSASDRAEEASLDALLVRFGGDYHRPPDIAPREEMWHAIRQKDASRTFIHRHPTWNSLAAAVLLLGVGIGIGVDMHSHLQSHFAPVHSVAALPSAVAAARTTATSTPSRADIAPIVPHDVNEIPPKRAASQATNEHGVGNYVYADASTPANTNARSEAYALATVRHFTAVEALLTSFQTSPHDARGDAQMAAWARALLSQTRLLLDSPAASDPARRKLLQDLELVLVQMSQLSPSDNPIDREMIDGSVRSNDVITRLRTAVPAGGSTHLQ